MIISQAWASAAEVDASTGGLFASFLPIILIFVVFYFFLIRPQQKKIREHQQMVGALKRGDKVITGGGLMGKITKLVNDNEVTVEIAKGVEVTAVKTTLTVVPDATAPTKKELGDKIAETANTDSPAATKLKKKK